MTKQRMAQRLAEGGAAADFEADQRICAAKEESGLSRLREDLFARGLVDRLRALMTPTNTGYITLCWKDGIAGCSMANGVTIGASAGAKTVPDALDKALLEMTEVGF